MLNGLARKSPFHTTGRVIGTYKKPYGDVPARWSVYRLPSPHRRPTPYPPSCEEGGKGETVIPSRCPGFLPLSPRERGPACRWFFGRPGGEVCVSTMPQGLSGQRIPHILEACSRYAYGRHHARCSVPEISCLKMVRYFWYGTLNRPRPKKNRGGRCPGLRGYIKK